MELYTSFWEALSIMGVTVRLFLRVKMKNIEPLLSLEKI
jgi:hypothetical protein